MGKIFGISDILNAVFNRDANKLKVETDLQIDAVTVTDVTIHDAVATDNKLKVNEDGSVPVELTGSLMEIYKPTVEERPAANSVPVGACFMAVNTGEVWQSNGTDWVEV